MSEKSLKIEEAYGELNLEMMKEFTDANGISGNEKAATRVMKKWLSDVSDEVTYDNLGSLIVTKKGSGLGPKLMVAGHVDEIGFVVRSIDDKGFIKLAPVGGWWGHVLLSQALTITTREGKEIMGIVGSKPPHGMPADVRSKVIDVKKSVAVTFLNIRWLFSFSLIASQSFLSSKSSAAKVAVTSSKTESATPPVFTFSNTWQTASFGIALSNVMTGIL